MSVPIAKSKSSCLIGIHFQKPTLFTTDLRGLHHVLTHGNIYQKPDLLRQSLSKITGQGEYTAFKTRMWLSLYPDQASCGWKVINTRIRGESWYARLIICLSEPHWPHQNPAFGPTQIRQFTNIFTEKANQVCHDYTLYLIIWLCGSFVNCYPRR